MRIVLLFLLLSVTVVRLPAQVFTVDQLVEIALSNNLDLKKTSFMADSMKADIGANNSWDDLKLMYSAQYISPTDPMKLQHMISIEQMFPLWGKNEAQAGAAEMDYEASTLQLQLEKRLLRSKILSLVLDFSAAHEQAVIEQDKLRMLDKLTAILKTEYATGKGMIAGIIDIEIRISEVKFNLIELSNRLATLKNMLMDVLDLPMTNIEFAYPFMDHSKITLDLNSAPSIIQTVISNSPEYWIADTQVEKFADLAAFSTAEFYPDLGVGVSYMYTPSMQDSMFSVNLMLNLPVFSYGKKQGMTEFYQAKKAEAETMKAAMKDMLEKDAARMIMKIKSLTDQVNLLKDQILKLGENNISSMLAAYQVQKADFSELLDSILMYYRMKSEYVMTLRMLFDEVLGLEVLTGKTYYVF